MSKSIAQFQNTLARPVEINGIGVHSGRYVEMTIHPAPAHHGIIFYRTDVIDANHIIPATVEEYSDHAIQKHDHTDHNLNRPIHLFLLCLPFSTNYKSLRDHSHGRRISDQNSHRNL